MLIIIHPSKNNNSKKYKQKIIITKKKNSIKNTTEAFRNNLSINNKSKKMKTINISNPKIITLIKNKLINYNKNNLYYMNTKKFKSKQIGRNSKSKISNLIKIKR